MSAEYINALLNGQAPLAPPPTEQPYRAIAELLLNVPISERARELASWVEHAGDEGEAVMLALMQIQGDSVNAQAGRPSTLGRLWRLDELLAENFGELPVLVGTNNNGILVRGEGHLIVGQPGIGKTLLIFDLALRLAQGLDFLGFPTRSPLKVLIVQNELPIQYVQYRFRRMREGYEREDIRTLCEAMERIFFQEFNGGIDLSDKQNRDLIAAAVSDVGADVVMIDPFLSYFNGDENNNSEVRNYLDALKQEIAIAHNCVLLMTDHLPKSSKDNTAIARGAGAKIDWAATVINLSHPNNGQNETEPSIDVRLTKVRYGPTNAEKITLRRDIPSLRHSVVSQGNDTRHEQLHQIFIEAGGEISRQERLLQLVRTRMSVSIRIARNILESAISAGVIVRERGRHNAFTYRLAERTEEDFSLSSDGEELV